MNVRVRCFARIRELVGAESLDRELGDGSTAGDCFTSLAAEFAGLAELRGSTRFVRDNAFIGGDAALRDGDEVGLLPPYGGG